MGYYSAACRMRRTQTKKQVFQCLAWQSLGESNPSFQVENLTS